MKRLALAVALIAMAAACKKAEQQGQMAGDTGQAMVADTGTGMKAMADTGDTSHQQMAGDTSKR